MAWSLGKRKVILEMDNMFVVHVMNKMVHKESFHINAHSNLVQAIKIHLDKNWAIQIQHVYLKRNRCADYVVNHAFLAPPGFYFHRQPFVDLINITRDNFIGVS